MRALTGLVAAMLLVPVALQAREVVVSAPNVVASACELHIRPTRKFQVVNTGYDYKLGYSQSLERERTSGSLRSIKQQLAEGLTPSIQFIELGKVDPIKALGFPATTTLIEDESFEAPEKLRERADLKAKFEALAAVESAGKRMNASVADCYGELLVLEVAYKHAAYNLKDYDSLAVFYWFRDFRSKGNAPRIYKGVMGERLVIKPSSLAAEIQDQESALMAAYKATFAKWADQYYRKAKH